MKKITLILFISVTSFFLNAQNTYPATGSFWNYGYAGHSGGYDENVTIQVTHDTLINGFETLTLRKTSVVTYSFPPNPPPGTMYSNHFGMIQYRNDSVFYYGYAWPNNEQFLYSFDMIVGDTVEILSFPSFYAVVDTMYNVDVDGFVLKKWELSNYCNGNPLWETSIIEKIGPIDDYLLWNTDGCIIGGGNHYFQCFSSPELHYNTPCQPLILGVEELTAFDSFVDVYPNPSAGFFNISLKKPLWGVKLKVENILGQVVVEKALPGPGTIEIDLSGFETGQYVLILESGDFSARKMMLNE